MWGFLHMLVAERGLWWSLISMIRKRPLTVCWHLSIPSKYLWVLDCLLTFAPDSTNSMPLVSWYMGTYTHLSVTFLTDNIMCYQTSGHALGMPLIVKPLLHKHPVVSQTWKGVMCIVRVCWLVVDLEPVAGKNPLYQDTRQAWYPSSHSSSSHRCPCFGLGSKSGSEIHS